MVYATDNLSFWLLFFKSLSFLAALCKVRRKRRQKQRDRVGEVPKGWEGDGPTAPTGCVDPWPALTQSPEKVADFQRRMLNRMNRRLNPKPGVPSLHEDPVQSGRSDYSHWIEGNLKRDKCELRVFHNLHTTLEVLRSPGLTALKFSTNLVGQRLRIRCKESKFL